MRAIAAALLGAVLFAACGGGGHRGGGSGPVAPTPPPPKTTPTPAFPGTTIKVVVHVCGDSFVGLAAYNDLATQSDRARLAGDLLGDLNSIWSTSGVQVDVGGSGLRNVATSVVLAADPTLVQGGFTVIGQGNATDLRWGNLGVDAADPSFGSALDVFLVQRGLGDILGRSALAGTFEGRGTSNGAAFALFSSTGVARTRSELAKAMAHELGHFLSLRHTTESDFTVDTLTDTPFSTVGANDTNGNGQLDANDAIASCPDAGNLMFAFATAGTTLTTQQGAQMRDYVQAQKH